MMFHVSDAIWIKVIETVPGVLWVLFAATVFLTLRKTIVRNFPRVTTFRAMGVEVELAGELLDKATDERQTPVSATDRRTALGRLGYAADLLRGGRILWVDDRPAGNTALVDLFRSVRMDVEQVHSTDEAIRLLRRKPYDVIISDVDRDGDPQAGIKMLRELDRYDINVPVLIHAAGFDPERGVDRRIFAATNVPVEVVHFVIDIMERARLGRL